DSGATRNRTGRGTLRRHFRRIASARVYTNQARTAAPGHSLRADRRSRELPGALDVETRRGDAAYSGPHLHDGIRGAENGRRGSRAVRRRDLLAQAVDADELNS